MPEAVDTHSPPDGVPAHHVRIVRELAAVLLADAQDIAAGMADRLHTVIPELAEAGAGPLMAQTRDGCRASVDQILRALARGDPVDVLAVPPEAIQCAQSCARRELPLVALLRAYQVGQAYFLERWTGALVARAQDPGLGVALVASTAWVFAYVDTVSNQLVAEYGRAQERWARTPDAIRAGTARAILDGTLHDDREAGRLLGHELARRHHLAAVMWESGRDPDGAPQLLQRAASAVADALDMSEPLVVLPDGCELWAWFSSLTRPYAAVPVGLAPVDGVRIALGRLGRGIGGFRKSHIEARAAAAVAALAGERAPGITHYDDVEVVSLLSSDLDRARSFVVNELDGLAGSGRPGARLRETILVLLQEGMSNSRAARRLHVHPNTVAYRAARAQELLGHRLVDRRIQLTAALMLAQTLGNVVLERDGGDPS